MDLIDKIGAVKRESRMARDNGEDAITWNVFRFLEKNRLVENWLKDITENVSIGIIKKPPEFLKEG